MRIDGVLETVSDETDEPPSLKTAKPSFAQTYIQSEPIPAAKARCRVVTPIVQGRRESFPVGDATRQFQRRFFPGTIPTEWNDWRWQVRTRIKTPS